MKTRLIRCHWCKTQASVPLTDAQTLYVTTGWDAAVTLRCRNLCPDCSKRALAINVCYDHFKTPEKQRAYT